MAEEFVLWRVKNTVRLSFHPAANARWFDVDYGERYHQDPFYRMEQDRKAAVGLYERFGRYGMGQVNPRPSITVGIQPLDFMNAALGGRIVYNREDTVWTPDQPLVHAQTVEDLERKGDINWERHPLLTDMFGQVEQLQARFPDLPVSSVQEVWRDGEEGQKTFLVMHTPYTTAFRVVGENIMVMMLDDEETAEVLFEWLLRQYVNLWHIVCRRMGWRGTKVHFGDCAATTLSPTLYERFLLPVYVRLMKNYESCVIHSCGRSSHLLELFARVPRVAQLQLGDGTDLALARALFPNSSISAYYDPGQFRTDKPDHIEAKLWRMREALGDNFTIDCGGADPDTPAKNVERFLETAQEINKI